MPGPWVSAAFDPDFAGGLEIWDKAFYEVEFLDNRRGPQGTGIICTLGAGKVGYIVLADYVAASDDWYGWYMDQKGRNHRGYYHFCKVAPKLCKEGPKGALHTGSFGPWKGRISIGA